MKDVLVPLKAHRLHERCIGSIYTRGLRPARGVGIVGRYKAGVTIGGVDGSGLQAHSRGVDIPCSQGKFEVLAAGGGGCAYRDCGLRADEDRR